MNEGTATVAPVLNGLVLAGGRSRRMGNDKAHLRHGDDTQLAFAVRLLEACVPRVFVSTRAEQADDPERARFALIVDRYDDLGPLAGILSAMDSDPQAAWLVLACDLPNIDVATLEHLCARRADDKPFTAYRSSRDGLPEPLCAIYRSGSDALIRAFVADGLLCPRKMLIRSDTALVELPDPAALDNINTPDDLDSSVLEAAS